MDPILKDLCVLIRKSTLHYRENCPQGDVLLTENFQECYGKYLRDKDFMVDFNRYTAVITTSVGNSMFVPNQWFVISTYALGVFTELMTYKEYLKQVCDFMGERPKTIIPKMRDATASINKELFNDACRHVFSAYPDDAIKLATKRLWRFATDYSWWSGNKTIDRTDFHLSVILNMLSLVNVSQSFVGDIVSDYYWAKMSDMLSDLSLFTETYSGPTFEISDYRDPKETATDVPMEATPVNTMSGEEIVISVRSKK